SLFRNEIEHDARIDLSWARSHRKSVERSESHGALGAASLLQRAHRSTATEMRDDHPALGDIRRDLRQGFRDVFVGETMKSVAPNALSVKLMWNPIVVCDRIMRAVKRGIEKGHS